MKKSKQRRLFVVLLAVALIISAFCLSALAADNSQPVEELECYDHGDVNGDGVVDRRDAVYVLYNSYFPNKYPVKQDCDFEKDDAIDRKDAVYLLYASFGTSPKYTLNGLVHSYYDPVWSWNTDTAEVTAQASFRCGCGQTHTVTTQDDQGVTVTAGTRTEATCVTPGAQEYTAQVTYENKTYTATTSVVIPANENGHDMVGDQGCEVGSHCSRCAYTLPALGHRWEQSGTVEATCTENAKLVYTCGRCGDTDEVAQEGTAGCKLSYYGEKQGANEYQRIKQYQCAKCLTITDGEAYCTHNYIAKITKEATCSAEGSKTLTCSACGDEQIEKIEKNDSHSWVEGSITDGVIAYSCACGATKTVVTVKEDEAIPADALKNNELQLENNTSVALDQEAAEKLDADKKVVITVEEVDLDTIGNVSDSDKAQVGDNAVYNFSMKYDGGAPITNFEGYVTVRLPYTLRPEDDADSIDVWYIADDGTIECVKGVYSNGYVTFQTNHFSYYTVTRLTPAQRCSVYGHVMTTSSKAATCTSDGYTTVFCQRCGWQESNVVAPMLGHDYKTIEDKAATCEQTGLKKDQCQNCQDIKSAVLPVLGHDMKDDETLSTVASCTAPGKTVSVCTRGCGHKVEKELPQLRHSFVLKETVTATCSANGYEMYQCESCDAEEKRNETAALGHKWNADDAIWQWNEDYTKATVTLVCAHEATHTKELTAVVTREEKGTACLGGTVTCTATASYNQVTYTDSVSDTLNGPGHKPADEWTTDNNQHYHLCSVCKEPVGAATHTWGQQKVVTEATCTKPGAATQTCTVCQLEKDVSLPATGVHTYQNGICSGCGKADSACDHKQLTENKLDLSEYGVCGGYIIVRSCECGQVNVVVDINVECDNLEDKEEELDEGMLYSSSCKDCGLYATMFDGMKINEESCTGSYVTQYVFSIGDTLIASAEQVYGTMQHPVRKQKDTVDLAQLGLCGGILETYTCPCGMYQYFEINTEESEKYCNFEGSETDVSCTACGATATMAVSEEKLDACTTITKGTVVIRQNGKDVWSGNINQPTIQHTGIERTASLVGDSCEDGVYLTNTCKDCGYTTEQYISSHSWVIMEKIDTSDAGFCADSILVYHCACGKNADFQFMYENEEETHSFAGESYYDRTCIKCGCHWVIENDQTEKDENCDITITTKHTFTDGDGHTYAFTLENKSQEHNNEYEYTLQGDSCEDGVIAKGTCKDCGHTSTSNFDWHREMLVGTYDLSEYGLCCEGIEFFSCPCGEYEQWYYSGYNYCQWTPIAGDENFMESKCRVCGIVLQESWEESKLDACTRLMKYTYTFMKDGEELYSFDFNEYRYNHRYIYEISLEPGATSCMEGYSGIGTCQVCGAVEEFWGGGECSTYAISRELLPSEGLCGQMELVNERCACGKNSGTSVYWVDSEQRCYHRGGIWKPELGAYLYTCETCGSKMSQRFEMEQVEGCLYKETYYNTYWHGQGTELCSVERVDYVEEHTYTYTFEMNGDTCQEGFRFTSQCLYCDETYTEYSGGECDYWNLSVEELGVESLCGRLLRIEQGCPCRNLSRTLVEWADDRERCQYDDGVWSEELDGWIYTCTVCGSQRAEWRNNQVSEDTPCKTIVTEMVTYYDAEGNALVSNEETYTYDSHPFVCEFTLYGETCADGFGYVGTCLYCGYQYNGSSYDDACEYLSMRSAYIAMPGCGGYVEERGCACGKYRWMNSEEKCSFTTSSIEDTMDDGLVHYIRTSVCQLCGLTKVQDQYTTDGKDSCHRVRRTDYTWTLGDWSISRTTEREEQYHDWEYISCSYRNPENTSCEQGILVTMRCRECDFTQTQTSYEHLMYKAGSIDLAQYGSVCGAALDKMTCACGARADYVLSADSKCDVDMKEVERFIEGALYENQMNSDGWQHAFSYCYTCKCAVTDPDCGLNLRMAEYWLQEGCYAVGYRVWQLEDGTEIAKTATGVKEYFHDYEQQDRKTTTTETGKVESQANVCKNCQSTDTFYYYYNAQNQQIKYERIALNTLEDGHGRSYTEMYEYVYMGGYQRIRLDRTEMVRADNSVYWYQTEKIFDEENPCKATRIYTSSDGGYSEDQAIIHEVQWKTEWNKQPTCTQFGEYVEKRACVYCGTVEWEHTYQESPKAHYWLWSNEEQIYFCQYCGLKNQNASSGSIVMEDLTDAYANGNYVIGYWNRGEVAFNPYVSLVLYDVEGDNNELVLTGIDFDYLTVAKDDVCGLSFSKSAVDAAAEAAISAAGYTGSYAVRISFVPTTGDNTLDYAITFDTVNA